MNYKYELQWVYELRYKESTKEERANFASWGGEGEKPGTITEEVIFKMNFEN